MFPARKGLDQLIASLALEEGSVFQEVMLLEFFSSCRKEVRREWLKTRDIKGFRHL